MSRVTIDDITGDYYNDHTDKSIAICDVEVVPRKIVEMIIEECDIMKLQTIDSDYEKSVVRFTTCNILKVYAESLLKQFEEDD